MKITLKNFRCYEQETFDFGKQGLILLSGCSGKGKTTIMLGIHFALFGTGNKLVAHDKTSCSVILEFEDMVITRSKRPNRLILVNADGEYEDDSAQSIIDKKFGENFKTTGYISQNGVESFILMSPIDKLEFLEKFAFNDANLSDINKKCKEVIKERNDNLTKVSSQLEMAIQMVNELKKPEKVDFPIKCALKNREIAIKNEYTGLKNSNTIITRNRNKILSLTKEINAIEVLDASLVSIQEFIHRIEQKIQKLVEEKSDIDEENITFTILENETKLKKMIAQREVISLQETYKADLHRLNKLKEQELASMYENIQKTQRVLWKDYSKEDTQEIIQSSKQTLKDLDKMSKLQEEMEACDIEKTNIDETKKQIEHEKGVLNENKSLIEKLERQKEVYKCPCCNVMLKLNHVSNTLITFDEDIVDSSFSIDKVQEIINKSKKSLVVLENKLKLDEQKTLKYNEKENELLNLQEEYEEIPEYYDIVQQLEEMEEYLSNQLNLEKTLKSLDDAYTTKTFSRTILFQVKGLIDRKTKIDSILDDDNEYEETEEEVRNILKTQTGLKEKLETINKNIHTFSKEKTEYEQKLNDHKNKHIEAFTEIRNISTLNEEIKEKTTEIESIEDKKTNHEKMIELIEKYQNYEKELQQYNSWVKKIDTIRDEETECRKQYGSAVELKEKILEAESIALLNIITCINTHAQTYLDAFFPENPISVKLVPFKESKKGKNLVQKPQINLMIEYKSMEATLDMLSQGENSRVVLAFFLALSEIFESPFILMDECTSNLDQELNNIVMDSIKENFEGKLAVVIAHQVINGIFDNTINL
jgi:DNA repair exonuclease SbcCD ATPase subunit